MSGNATPIIDRTSYSDLLSSYQPSPIKTEKDNEKALMQVEALMHEESLTAAESKLLELLVQLIERFENEFYTIPIDKQASPLDLLHLLMESNNVKQADLVNIVGSRGVVSEVVNGKRGISKRMAIALGKRFNVEPGLFLS